MPLEWISWPRFARCCLSIPSAIYIWLRNPPPPPQLGGHTFSISKPKWKSDTHTLPGVEFGREQEARLMWSWIKRQELTVVFIRVCKAAVEASGICVPYLYSWVCNWGCLGTDKHGVVLVTGTPFLTLRWVFFFPFPSQWNIAGFLGPQKDTLFLLRSTFLQRGGLLTTRQGYHQQHSQRKPPIESLSREWGQFRMCSQRELSLTHHTLQLSNQKTWSWFIYSLWLVPQLVRWRSDRVVGLWDVIPQLLRWIVFRFTVGTRILMHLQKIKHLHTASKEKYVFRKSPAWNFGIKGPRLLFFPSDRPKLFVSWQLPTKG